MTRRTTADWLCEVLPPGKPGIGVPAARERIRKAMQEAQPGRVVFPPTEDTIHDVLARLEAKGLVFGYQDQTKRGRPRVWYRT